MNKPVRKRSGEYEALSQREIDKAFETHWNRNQRSVVSTPRKRSQKEPDGGRETGRKAATQTLLMGFAGGTSD